jgi:hypothetical protein
MTMPVRPVRVRAGIVEIHPIVTNTVPPALDLGGTARAWTPAPTFCSGNRLGGTIVTSTVLGACYTGVTLNTAVVWCDGSGAVFDLRTPAFSFPSVSLQRNQN